MKRATMFFGLVVALWLGLMQIRPVGAQTELLDNPGFDDPFSNQGGSPVRSVASGWTAWHIPRPDDPNIPTFQFTQPEYNPASDVDSARVRTGSNAQAYSNFYTTHTAGVFQQVDGLTSGTALTFRVFAYVWSSSFDDPDFSEEDGGVIVQVGIDPNGGSDPQASEIVWSNATQLYDAYNEYTVNATANASAVSVWVRSTISSPVRNSFVYLDDASLRAAGSVPSATNTAAPTSTPLIAPTFTTQPTNTPVRTNTPVPTNTSAPTSTPLVAPTFTLAPSSTPAGAAQPATQTPAPTNTAIVAPTFTPAPSSTPVEVVQVPSNTAVPTNTAIVAPTFTPTPTETVPATATPSATIADAAEATDMAEATDAAAVPTATFDVTPTASPTSPFRSSILHTVRRGDTVAELATLYGSSIQAIIDANELNDNALIFVGQGLTIPVRLPPPATSTPIVPTPTAVPTVYIVQPGDTLSRIAVRFSTTVAVLRQINGIVNPDRILVGQVITLPNPNVPPLPTAVAATSIAPTPTFTPVPPLTYVVQPGDNLFRISLRLGVPLARLIQLNSILDANRIFVGQVLVIQ